jgi:DNA-binding transcriptional LysR family regulator
MKAYGYLRACYLEARFDDILRSYPNEQVPEDDLTAWIFLAQIALCSEKYDEARNILSILDARYSGNPFILELLANTHIADGDFAAADAIYRRLEDRYTWPASLIRLSDAYVGQHYATTEWDDPAERFEWLNCSTARDAERLFVIGVDDRYARRYLPELLDSFTRTYPKGGWRLHIHLINPVSGTLDWIANRQRSGIPLCVTAEQQALRPTETADAHRIIEMRTYHACARFRILPRLLEYYARPLWVIDADMLALRPIDTLLAETGDASAHIGIVPGKGARCLSEYVWLSLSHYVPAPETLRFTRTLARQLNHQLACDHWGWGLDQTTFFAVLAWFKRHRPDFRIAHIPCSCVGEPDGQHPDAYFRSLVGSME